ncbi:MAG: hypothetical protein HFF58_07560 [Lawsonibacter sp.]|jgi:hypothetical protein|nr:hypothetical protein [Lawsonibacter sp.]
MTEKIKTGLCVCALLLALLAAYVQERSWPESAANRVMIQPAPFASAVQIN